MIHVWLLPVLIIAIAEDLAALEYIHPYTHLTCTCSNLCNAHGCTSHGPAKHISIGASLVGGVGKGIHVPVFILYSFFLGYTRVY